MRYFAKKYKKTINININRKTEIFNENKRYNDVNLNKRRNLGLRIDKLYGNIYKSLTNGHSDTEKSGCSAVW